MIAFRLVTGRKVDLADPTLDDVSVCAIACGLSKICRYTGQLRDFYSVAQHAVMVSEVVDAPLRFAALHHDDSEAYLNDISRNLKHSAALAGYRRLEELWTFVIETALEIRLTPAQRAQIKLADDLIAVYERTVVRDRGEWQAARAIDEALASGFVNQRREDLISLAERIPTEWCDFPSCLSPAAAESKFLERHRQYLSRRD